MARRQKNPDDAKYWAEVLYINNYAIFMGYLLMGVRGLGLLVFTWTTVVLLGGFVSTLKKKDFWCLTVITLVQIVGVFDFLLKERVSDVGSSSKGLLFAVQAVFLAPFNKKDKKKGFLSAIFAEFNKGTNTSKVKQDNNKGPWATRLVIAAVLWVVQALVLVIVLCPLAILYVFGLYLPTGISLWRLIQHDYGNADGGSNLKPALNILYSLGVAQGVVYGYRAIYDLAARTGLVEDVADHYSIETGLVSEYLDETVAGCMKDPSFARGRNLVTYAVDLLMESMSRYGYISGVLILGRVTLQRRWDHGQLGLMKQLLTGSTSFRHVVQRLVETFGPASPYSTEIRVQAARIVATVAGSIRLDHFPAQGMMIIQSVSSLLDTFEEYSWRPEGYDERPQRRYHPEEFGYERDWLLDNGEVWYQDINEIPRPKVADSNIQGYKGLVVQGLRILQGLAINEDNCRVIVSHSQDLLSKAIAPLLVLDQLHRGDQHDDECCSMAEESLRLMKRLMATPPGETETKLRNEISGNTKSIITAVKGILECLTSHVLLKRQAVEVLVVLSVDTHTLASIMPSGSSSSSSRTMFLWILLHISLVPDYHFDRKMCGSTHLAKKSSDIKRLAGERLKAMLSSHSSMLRSVGDVIGSLARTVAGTENNAYRIHAATILKHLCQYYTKDDENLKELKKSMTDVVPEVLKEIVHWLTTEEKQVVTEANNGGREGLDLEQGAVPHDNDNGQESSSTPHQQKGEQHQGIIELQEALIELCCAVIKWIDKGQDLTHQFNEIAATICSGQGMPQKTFKTLVYEALQKLWGEEFRLKLVEIES